MSNQDRLLSEEELNKQLHEILWNHHLVPSADDVEDVWKKNPTNITDTATAQKQLFDLINTQKRLYAESVIGEDEKMYNPPYQHSSEKAVRNLLRAEQRARIK